MKYFPEDSIELLKSCLVVSGKKGDFHCVFGLGLSKERFCEETRGRGGLCYVLVKVMVGFFVRFTGYFLFIWFIMKEDGNFGEMGMRMPERKSSAGHVIL